MPNPLMNHPISKVDHPYFNPSYSDPYIISAAQTHHYHIDFVMVEQNITDSSLVERWLPYAKWTVVH